MPVTISIDQAGRLVLPKAIRERFRLGAGSLLELETVGDHLELKPFVDEEQIEVKEHRGRLVISGGEDETLDLTEVIRADREEREGKLSS